MNVDAKAQVLDNEPRRGKHSLIARALGSVILNAEFAKVACGGYWHAR
jgi:hypothetical protein